MGSSRSAWARVAGVLAAAVMLLAAPAGEASASARVRFVQAVGGEGPTRLVATQEGRPRAATDSAGFGRVTPYVTVPAGVLELRLAPAGEGGPTTELDVADGRSYTVVALGGQDRQRLEVYPDARPAGGQARLRMIHASPELGSPDVRLGERVVAERVRFGEGTGYVSVQPATYELSITPPGGRGGPLASRSGVALAAGTTSTAVLVGSGGEEQRLVVATDATVRPPGAPQTGLGGLSGAPWAAMLLAALAAGAAGAGTWLLAARRKA